MNRKIAALLSVLLVFVTLTGCGSSANAGQGMAEALATVRAEAEVLLEIGPEEDGWTGRLRKRTAALAAQFGRLLSVPSPEGDTFAGLNEDGVPFVEIRRNGVRGGTLFGLEEAAPELERWVGVFWEDAEHFVLIGENRTGSESPYISVTMEVCREKNVRPLANVVSTEAQEDVSEYLL